MIRSILIFSLLLSASTLSSQQVSRSFNEQGQFLRFQLYTDSGGTKDETEGLMEDLRAWNIPYFAADETAMAPPDLSNHRLLFIHTDLEHDMVMHYRMQLRSYLNASCLSNRQKDCRKHKNCHEGTLPDCRQAGGYDTKKNML